VKEIALEIGARDVNKRLSRSKGGESRMGGPSHEGNLIAESRSLVDSGFIAVLINDDASEKLEDCRYSGLHLQCFIGEHTRRYSITFDAL
jgi:hypothetical protein